MLDGFVLIRSVMMLFIELVRFVGAQSGVELVDARTPPIGEWDHVKIINNPNALIKKYNLIISPATVTVWLLFATPDIGFKPIPTGYSQYPLLSSPASFASCSGFYSFGLFPPRISPRRSLCSFRFTPILFRTCSAAWHPRSWVSESSASSQRYLYLFSGSRNRFFLALFLVLCPSPFSPRSFKYLYPNQFQIRYHLNAKLLTLLSFYNILGTWADAFLDFLHRVGFSARMTDGSVLRFISRRNCITPWPNHFINSAVPIVESFGRPEYEFSTFFSSWVKRINRVVFGGLWVVIYLNEAVLRAFRNHRARWLSFFHF